MAAVGGLIITSIYSRGRPTIERTSYIGPLYKRPLIRGHYIETFYKRPYVGPLGP